MQPLDPLRRPGRAGGEGEVGEIAGADRDRGRRLRQRGEERAQSRVPPGGQHQPARRGEGRREVEIELGSERAGGGEVQPGGRRGEREHLDLPRRGVRRVEDDEGRAGLEHAEHRPCQGGAAVAVDADRVALLHPHGDQAVGEAVGLRLELAVGPGAVAVADGGTAGVLGGAPSDQLVDGAAPGGVERRPRVGEDGRRGRGEERQALDRPRRVGRRLLEDELELRQQLLAPRRREEVGVVDQLDRHPLALVPQVGGEVELRRRLGEGELAERHPRQRQLGEGEVEQVEVDLEEGRPRQVALRLQGVEEHLEGHVLMGVGAERRLPHPRHQLGEGGVAGEVGAQHQGVEEHPDQPLDLGASAAGDRRADDDVGLAGEPVQQHLEGGEEGHEERRAGVAAEPPQAAGELAAEPPRAAAAAVGLHRRPRPVGRQLEAAAEAGEAAAPVVELPGERLAAAVAALPDGVVGVLDRQRREGRRAPLDAGAVELRALGREHAERPAVADDVMEGEEERPVRLAEAEQAGAPERRAGEVEGRGGLRRGEPGELRLARRRRQRGEVDPRQQRQVRREEGQHPLHRAALDAAELGAQRPVPPRHRGEAVGEGAGIEGAGEAQRRRDVVRRAPRLEAVEDPQALLGERERQPAAAGGLAGDGRDRRHDGGRVARPRTAATSAASSATVGRSKSRRSGSSTPSASRMRAASWVARSEWPPRSKKSSWMPIRGMPRISE